MKYFLFALFILGSILILTGIRRKKNGGIDGRYKARWLLYFLGILCYGIMIAVAMLTDF